MNIQRILAELWNNKMKILEVSHPLSETQSSWLSLSAYETGEEGRAFKTHAAETRRPQCTEKRTGFS